MRSIPVESGNISLMIYIWWYSNPDKVILKSTQRDAHERSSEPGARSLSTELSLKPQ